MAPKAKGKAKVTQKESKESFSQDSIKTPSWFELIQKNEKTSSSSSKTKIPDQKASISTESTKMLSVDKNQNPDQKVSMEAIGMLPIVSIDEIARTNALALASIFSQNKEVVDPTAP